MRYFDEYNNTTNNYVYNRLRIPYVSNCGWCSPGSRCCAKRKNKYYHVSRYYKKKEGRVVTTEFEYKGIYPNWKLVSKNKKQWMNKPVKKQLDTYQTAYMREMYPDNYEFKWIGNDRYQN